MFLPVEHGASLQQHVHNVNREWFWRPRPRVAGIASFVRAVDQTASTTMVDLDLVVTMDSAIARPVGAMGLPTCTLIHE
jgi:hypothetical protein